MDSLDRATPGAICIHAYGQQFILLKERAVFWPDQRTVIVADIHFGKAATFRKHGLPVPDGDTVGDLKRLTSLIEICDAQRLIVAGDLLHAASSKSPETLAAVEKWRRYHSQLEVVLVSGNHDKSAGKIPTEWEIAVHPESLREGSIVFLHDPADIPVSPDAFYLCGHLHPAIALAEGRVRSLKAPCFWQTPNSLVLPGFGKFTGSKAIRPATADQVFAITRNGVVSIPHALLKKR